MTPQSAAWFILFTPLIMAVVILFVGKLGKPVSSGLAIAGAAFTCVLSWWLFAGADFVDPVRIEWIDFGKLVGAESPAQLYVPIGLTIDALSKVMLLVVTTIATLVFIYSVGYMATEEGYTRFFAALSLFLFSMLGIVLADNFVMMFIFWELVGVSSFILIGHYFGKDSAAEACKQAFTVNRIGDFGFMLGILVFWFVTGSVIFSEIGTSLGGFDEAPIWLNIAVILVFCGTVGKSAQLPLHVWLPNSMEGPTPVSSLLHAATMVAAGVYMLARIFPIVLAAPIALEVIGWIGVLTCFVAGLMAIQQNDIKRILAYSTISQLGYMVLGVAVGPVWGIPMFHLFTHAFFKCLLFLCAGSVIVGMHHKQDIWEMGGLAKKMPITFLAMVIGTLALIGAPFFAGSFSKDLIIEYALGKSALWYWISAGAVVLTAAYMTRLIVVVFFGAPRTDHARKAHESSLIMTVPLMLLSLAAFGAGYPLIQKQFIPVTHPENLVWWAHPVILIFLVIGVLSAILIYRRAGAKDPVYIPAFANRLYIDNAYAWLVRWAQDGTASLLGWVDRWVIEGVGVQFTAKVTWAAGFALRFLQFGNIQAYVFFFGAGVIALIYFLLATT